MEESDVSSGLVRCAIGVARSEMDPMASTFKKNKHKYKSKIEKRDKLKLKKTNKMKMKMKCSEKKIRATEKPNGNGCGGSSSEKQSPQPEQKEDELQQPIGPTELDIGSHEEEDKLQMVAETKKTKKQVQRSPIIPIWSREDEIKILKALIEYKNGGNDVCRIANDEIFKMMQDKLDIEFSKTQLKDKIKKMRQKFRHKVESKASLKGHKLDLFQLSYQLWGKTVPNISSSSLPNSFLDLYCMLNAKSGSQDALGGPTLVIREGYKLLSDSTREELEEKCRKIEFQLQELGDVSTQVFYSMLELTVKAFRVNQ